MDAANAAEPEDAAAAAPDEAAVEVDSGSVSARPNEPSNTSSETRSEAVPNASGPKRARRRGLGSRKRPALKIDAECTTEGPDSCEDGLEIREAQPTPGAGDEDGDSSASDAKSVPWWVLEYKCPPPGHLGAHHVALSAAKSEMTVNTAADSAADPDKSIAPQNQQTEQQPVRKLLSESLSARQRTQQQIDAPVYSPSQKRKMDASALSPTTEPKRLREPPASVVQRVTPSNLVRPLTKIDIHCQRSGSADNANASSSEPPGLP